MRVLFLASNFPKPGNEAIGPWALTQARAFQRLGLEVQVVSPTSWVPGWAAWSRGARVYSACPVRHDWEGLEASYPRWLFYQVGPIGRLAYRRPRPFLEVAWCSIGPALDRAAAAWRPEVIYTHHTGVNGLLAARLGARRGVPFVVTEHDHDEIADCDRYPGRRSLFRQVLGKAGAVVALSSIMRRSLVERFPGANVQVIHNGCGDLPQEAREARQATRPPGRFVLFSAGMFYQRKEFPLLIQAFARVARAHPEAELRIAGDGPLRSEVEAAAAVSGVSERIHLLGLVPRQEVLRQMARCDAFGLIGRNEPFATVFLEACAAGVPLVIANDGGFMDLFVDGVHGRAVPPGDARAAAGAIESLLLDAAARVRMGNMARRLWEEQLSWGASAARYAALFTDVASRRTGA